MVLLRRKSRKSCIYSVL